LLFSAIVSNESEVVFMYATAVTLKGQIVIPSEIRLRHSIKKGTKISFIEQGEDIILRPLTDDYIDRLRGSIKTKGKALKSLLEERRRDKKR
jgi:AbrB family looped-hinge helix DNA binding protein